MSDSELPPGGTTRHALTLRAIAAVWAPLAASWLLMGLELPAVSAVMARLPDAKASLAAYGGVVFPTALIFESPIIMLLSASTALARDMASYRLVRRFMFATAGALVALHALVAFTPLFDVLVGPLLAVPVEAREPARTGLRIMLPWVISIAFRRTAQGVLIRTGRARAITFGTLVRLGANLVVLAAGLAWRHVPGIVVGTTAVACGVLSEAAYTGLAVRPALRELRTWPAVQPPLTLRAFMRFYLPLMVTPLINFISMPLGAAAMSRMPRALDSLATWPVVSGASFTLRGPGFALNEVVVAKLDEFRPLPALRRFTWALAAGSTGLLLALSLGPVGHAWFRHVAALPADLLPLATVALAWLALSPGGAALQSLHQGILVHAHRTRGVTESVIVNLFATGLVLGAGVLWQRTPGVHFAAAGLTAGALAQAGWLALRSRAARAELHARDARD